LPPESFAQNVRARAAAERLARMSDPNLRRPTSDIEPQTSDAVVDIDIHMLFTFVSMRRFFVS